MILCRWDSSVLKLFVSFRHRGPAPKEGRVEPSDQAGGRGEGTTATWHPGPLWQTEQSQWELVAKACSPSSIWPHYCWNRGCLHKGVFLPDVPCIPPLFCITAKLHKIILELRLCEGPPTNKPFKQSLLKNNKSSNELTQPPCFLITPPASSTLSMSPFKLDCLCSFQMPAVYATSSFVPVQILESSQSLLCVLKKEAGNLSKATEPRRKEHWWWWSPPTTSLSLHPK